MGLRGEIEGGGDLHQRHIGVGKQGFGFFEPALHDVVPNGGLGFGLEFRHESRPASLDRLKHVVDKQRLIEVAFDVMDGAFDIGGIGVRASFLLNPISEVEESAVTELVDCIDVSASFAFLRVDIIGATRRKKETDSATNEAENEDNSRPPLPRLSLVSVARKARRPFPRRSRDSDGGRLLGESRETGGKRKDSPRFPERRGRWNERAVQGR